MAASVIGMVLSDRVIGTYMTHLFHFKKLIKKTLGKQAEICRSLYMALQFLILRQ